MAKFILTWNPEFGGGPSYECQGAIEPIADGACEGTSGPAAALLQQISFGGRAEESMVSPTTGVIKDRNRVRDAIRTVEGSEPSSER